MIRHTPVTLDTLNSVETFAFSILMVAFFSALSVTVTIYIGKMIIIKYSNGQELFYEFVSKITNKLVKTTLVHDCIL